ncbi:helix-turn-helix transcriptional regulator [Bacillus sp. CH30_1T]|uniref:helix-turn-helix transcriptional regulator n=1 Tax=Bacillus sp. CH30_1T TaxID=2604836 RepID=UPI0011EF6D44|nr:helix-turn-helix transcriptional regulator [Bacillus sp. CH30_1T]KAA0563506.1 helix-turn-helix transcriptional regulator [Bacillus sp. CH30_1T]
MERVVKINYLGTKLKQIRTKKKLTQSELAKGIVNRSYISQIEKGSVQPSFKLLKKFSERLNCDINDFFEERETPSYKLDLQKTLSSLEYLVVNEDLEEAKIELNEIEPSIAKLNLSEQALYYFCKGKLEGQEDSAIDYLRMSCELYSQTKMRDERLRSINHLVNILIEKNRIHEAFEILDNAYDESIFYRINGIEKISLLTNLGIAHAKLGEYYSAIRFLKQAISTSNKSNVYYLTGRAYMVLGLCQRRIANYEKAINSYNKALLFFKGSDDVLNTAGTYTNLGILKRFQSDFTESLIHLKKANQLYGEIKDDKGILNSYYEMALSSLHLKKYSNIHSLYSDFIEHFCPSASNIIHAKFLVLLGDTFYEEKKEIDAINVYRKALIISNEFSLPLQREILIRLSKVYSDLNDFESVLKCWKNFKQKSTESIDSEIDLS